MTPTNDLQSGQNKSIMSEKETTLWKYVVIGIAVFFIFTVDSVIYDYLTR